MLRDDSLRFHAALGAARVDGRLCAIAGMEHVAVVRGLDLPGAAETFAAVRGVIAEAIAS